MKVGQLFKIYNFDVVQKLIWPKVKELFWKHRKDFEFNGLLSFPLQIHLKFRLKSKIFCHVMITLNFTHKPSTKAILALPIQNKLQKGPCNKSYLHNYPFIFTIRSFFKQIKHMMHKIDAILLCRHLWCHTPEVLEITNVTTRNQRWCPQTSMGWQVFHGPRRNPQAHGVPP